jgi:hypothetical protein
MTGRQIGGFNSKFEKLEIAEGAAILHIHISSFQEFEVLYIPSVLPQSSTLTRTFINVFSKLLISHHGIGKLHSQ